MVAHVFGGFVLRCWEVFLLAVGLAMDAFAVSILNGLTAKPTIKQNFAMAGAFGVAQMLFPLIGLLLGAAFYNLISNIDHWIALMLLAVLGIKMLADAKKNPDACEVKLTAKIILIQAVATAIDALAVGIGLAAMTDNIPLTVLIIGVVTFLLSLAGTFGGKLLGKRICRGARVLGGLILIGVGVKIFIEHMFFSGYSAG